MHPEMVPGELNQTAGHLSGRGGEGMEREGRCIMSGTSSPQECDHEALQTRTTKN